MPYFATTRTASGKSLRHRAVTGRRPPKRRHGARQVGHQPRPRSPNRRAHHPPPGNGPHILASRGETGGVVAVHRPAPGLRRAERLGR
jgi:hypothetical protein